jgi:hypothetical protein
MFAMQDLNHLHVLAKRLLDAEALHQLQLDRAHDVRPGQSIRPHFGEQLSVNR